MIISILTILFLIILHFFPRRIRARVLSRIRRIVKNFRKSATL